MVRQLILALAATLALSPAKAAPVDLAAWAKSLPTSFHVEGGKVEPTYIEAVEIRRDGDVIGVVGGAPAWMERSRETLAIAADGTMRRLDCPRGMDCAAPLRPAGFLSTAALIAAARRGALVGTLETQAYGRFEVVCVPAERLGVERPILDPCFERGTGAAIAQRNRFSGRFDGPSLDPDSISFASKDKAS